MHALVWVEPKGGRQRAIRVAGHLAEYGQPALVTLNTMIQPADMVGPMASTGQTNLSPTSARILASDLIDAADAAETTDYRLIWRAVEALTRVKDRDMIEGTLRTLNTTLQKIDDGEL